MANVDNTSDRATKWMRRIARGIGLLVGAFWLISLVASLVADLVSGDPAPSWEGKILAGLIVAVVVGVAIAWRWERIGGTIVVIGAIALGTFSYVTAGFNKVWVMLITGGPLLVAGILFMICGRRTGSLKAWQAADVPRKLSFACRWKPRTRMELAVRVQRVWGRKRIGLLGEELVYHHERANLEQDGRSTLSQKVRLIAVDDDPLGYNILSSNPDGPELPIEESLESIIRVLPHEIWDLTVSTWYVRPHNDPMGS